MNRRTFLKSSGLALVAGPLLPNVFVRMANAATTKGNKTLVAIFQRGAVDGLNMLVPYGEQAYYAARPTIAVPRPGAEGGAIDIDGFFGLHPSLASLAPYFKDHSAAAPTSAADSNRCTPRPSRGRSAARRRSRSRRRAF